MQPATLAELRAAWLAAKQQEHAAAEERRLIEEAMLAHLPNKREGIVTDKDHGITVTFKLNRKVDTEALQAKWHQLTENAQRAFRWKAEVDMRQLKAISDLDEAASAYISQFITTSPAKPAFSIKD
jgi:hypothetical protein